MTAAGGRHIWLHEGFACYAEWLWTEFSGGVDAGSHALRYYSKLQNSRRTSSGRSRPETCSTTASTSAAP